MASDPLDHVMDNESFHFILDWHYHLPKIGPLQLTKYMVLQLVAAVLILLIFIPVARRAKDGDPPRGVFWNLFEVLLTFIRDQIAKPYLGHDADRFVPFLWTLFLFILFNNLLGMFPFMGSPTASISVTGALALIAFLAIHGAAVYDMGPAHYLKSFVPHIHVPFGMGYALIPMIVIIEAIGHFIKAFVLAVRLFANMFAGHTVLSVILLFIVMAREAPTLVSAGVTVGSVLGVTALSLLELFVAFLQAYIFTFLTTLFLGSTLHPAH